MIRLALIGVTGRMGRALVAAAAERDAFVVTGACASPGSAALGQPVGRLGPLPDARGGAVPVVADPARAVADAQVAVDFSLASATVTVAAACRDAGCALVSGVTGLDAAAARALDAAAGVVPVLHARNMSLGVNLLAALVEAAAGRLDATHFDAEVFEMHHRGKRDAPSGTALLLGEAISAGRGVAFDACRAPADRSGPREAGQIGFAVSRGGGVAGEHTVTFAGDHERLEFTHRAAGRGVFAQGALQAAAWLAQDRPPGRYSMKDVLQF